MLREDPVSTLALNLGARLWKIVKKIWKNNMSVICEEISPEDYRKDAA